METRRARQFPGFAKAFFEFALLPWRTGLERDTKVMLVNISLDADRVARTDVPLAELLIVGGNHDVGRVWQASNVEMRRRASARWGHCGRSPSIAAKSISPSRVWNPRLSAASIRPCAAR